MPEQDWTMLYDGTVHTVPVSRHGERLLAAPADIKRALGWEVKDATLCRADRCVPIGAADGLAQAAAIDVAALASCCACPWRFREPGASFRWPTAPLTRERCCRAARHLISP